MSNNQEPWWTPGNNLVPKALADHNENSSWVSGSERSRNYRWMVKLIRSSVLKASAVDCRSISSIDTPSAPRHLGTSVDTRSTPRWTFGRESTNFQSLHMRRSTRARISTIDFRLPVSIWNRRFFRYIHTRENIYTKVPVKVLWSVQSKYRPIQESV